MIRVIAIGAAACLAAAPSAARVVDYTLDDSAMRAAAAELKITPIAARPERGIEDIALTIAPTADHVTLALGMFCSAYKVENPVSRLMTALAAAWDQDGRVGAAANAAPVRLTIATARSYRRCVEVKEANTRCITKVSIAGTIEARGNTLPVVGEAERDASIGGFCASLARGIGVVSREAGIALITDARTKLATLQTR